MGVSPEWMAEYQRKRRESRQEFLTSYLLENPCADCGEDDVVVLQFDHVKGEKKGEIKGMLGSKWETLFEELTKCEVRCANCHVRRHAREG